jgi:hypothetical protein
MRGTRTSAIVIALAAICVVAAAALFGLSRTKPKSIAASAPPEVRLTGLPVQITTRQRSTTPVPGSGEKLLLTVDDVTRGQIQVTLLEKNRAALFGPISMTPDMSIPFRYGSGSYSLSLKRLDNALVGEDFAEFAIAESSPSDAKLSEDEKIERLIGTIASLERAAFIRNGAEHKSVEAANHLREKWNAERGEIKTARDFIRLIASESSLSGEPYRIRFPDGKEVNSADFLRDRLAEIEASPSSVASANEPAQK